MYNPLDQPNGMKDSKQTDVLRAPVPRQAGYLSTSPTKAYELHAGRSNSSERTANEQRISKSISLNRISGFTRIPNPERGS